jgi:predicted Zn-dependent protease
VVGFGTPPSGYLGMTCWWTMSGIIFESDMRLNKAYYHFYVNKPSSCSNRYSIEAVATHEFGHAFGLAHVSETYHPSLTMSTVIRSCQASESTLGLGDVRGLNALY